jgi:hypothetical protein
VIIYRNIRLRRGNMGKWSLDGIEFETAKQMADHLEVSKDFIHSKCRKLGTKVVTTEMLDLERHKQYLKYARMAEEGNWGDLSPDGNTGRAREDIINNPTSYGRNSMAVHAIVIR